ncbi:MAG: hypothetical protein U0821_08760 [Chloroflexota bacterium]
MIKRLIVAGALLAAITGLTTRPDQLMLYAAPANGVDAISFAHGMGSDGSPIGPAVEFGKDSAEVWAIIDFRNVPPGAKMTYLLRVNGEDYSWGDLNCCGGVQNGRLGFQLRKRNGGGGDLPGGAYRLFIYENDKEVAQGGFGVKGRQGLDNGNANSNH